MSGEQSDKGMALKFNLYDIFWYIAPGCSLVIAFYLYHRLFSIELFNDIENLFFSSAMGWQQIVGYGTIILFAMFVLGHLLAALSMSIFDKVVVERAIGYPFLRLFNSIYTDKISSVWYAKKSHKFYQTMILLASLIILSFVQEWRIIRWLFISLFALLFFLKGLFNYFALEDFWDSSSVRPEGQRHKANRIDVFCGWLMKPFTFIWRLMVCGTLGILFRMPKPFEKQFQENFSKSYYNTFKMPVQEVNTNTFWLPYWHLCQNDQNSFQVIQYLQRLYSFLQNLSMVLLILFIYSIFDNRVFSPEIEKIHRLWCVVAGVAFIMIFLRYYYVYYNLYSRSVYRAFVGSTLDKIS